MKRRSIPLLLLVTSLAAVGCATSGEGSSLAAASLRSQDLIGRDVRSASGQVVGGLHCLVFDAQSTEIQYAVISLSRRWALYGKAAMAPPRQELLIVPWNLVSFDPSQGGLRLHTSEDRWEQAPRLERLPSNLVRGWDDGIRKYWAGETE